MLSPSSLARRSAKALDLLPRFQPPPLRLACDPTDILSPIVEHVIQCFQLRILQHTRLDPGDFDRLVDLIQRSSNETETSISSNIQRNSIAHLNPFMRRCSTSCTGKRVASATDWKEQDREDPSRGREKANWIRAIKQIFCRRNENEFCKIGYIVSFPGGAFQGC